MAQTRSSQLSESFRLERAITRLWGIIAFGFSPAGFLNHYGVWIPTLLERQKCCEILVEQVSRLVDPPVDVYWNHCRSLEHVAETYQVDPAVLRERFNAYVETVESKSNGAATVQVFTSERLNRR